MSAPEWLVVGAEVATLRSDWRTNPQVPRRSRIARIGKRDVVLEDEQRFHVSRLTRHEGGTWGWTVRLAPADDETVLEAEELYRHTRLVHRAKKACDDFRYGKSDLTAFDVILALAPLTGVADEIAALDKAARP